MVKMSIFFFLSRLVRQGPTDKVTFEQRPMNTREWSEPCGSWREELSSRGNST